MELEVHALLNGIEGISGLLSELGCAARAERDGPFDVKEDRC